MPGYATYQELAVKSLAKLSRLTGRKLTDWAESTKAI